MLISNSEQVAGHTISQHLSVVTGNTVRSKHIGRDFMAGLKTIVGGEVRGYTEMLADARQEAINRMITEASRMQADAIINVRFTTSAIAQGMSEMLAYGTAVKLVSNNTSSDPGRATPPAPPHS